MQDKRLGVNRFAQVTLERHALHGLVSQVTAIELVGVSARRFGVVHRRIGISEQGSSIFTVFPVDGNADGGAQAYFTAHQGKGAAHQLQDSLGDLVDIGRLIDVHNQRGKFITPQAGNFKFVGCILHARHQVGRSYAFAQTACCPLQCHVTCAVAHGVVDVLEPVQIHEQHTKTGGCILGPAYFALNPVQKRLPVGQTREVVKHGQTQNLLLICLALRDVSGQGNKLGRWPGGVCFTRN